MGQYSKAIITAAGQSLIARAIAGEAQLNITKAKTSDYKYPDDTDYKALSDMEGIKQILELPETKVLENDLIQTRVLFSNEEIKATYYIHNIGLYVNDGTKEVLFCIVTADVPDEMPQYNGVAATSYIYNIQNVVKDAETIHITVSPAGNATIQDVMDRVDGTGGDISETVIETLEPIDTKYPVPSAGESTKVFMGKVKKYIEDTKPLDADMTVYVTNTGNDTSGTGTSTAPYKTITYALSKIPKNLNGYTATVNIAAGVYIEDVMISGFSEELKLVLAGDILINNLIIQGCKVVCSNGFSSNSRMLTTQYIQVAKNGLLSVWSGVKITTNSYIQDQPYAGRRSSIMVSESSVNIWDSVNIVGNTDIGVTVGSTSNCFINNISGTGLLLGSYISAGSTVSYLKNNLSASQLQWVDAGTVVSSFGARIGTLPNDVTLYVATTGSNITGDGSWPKPYKTVQYALNTLPKDLGGFTALILVSDGTYVEDIIVSAFSNGYVVIKRNVADQVINNLCNIRSIRVAYCTSYVDVHGINITASNIEGAVVEKCSNVTTFFRCQSVVDDGSINSATFKFEYCNRGRVIQCHTQNKRSAILARHTQVVSDTWNNSSSTKGVALVSAEAGSITTTGSQPSSPGGNTVQLTGGSFFKDNGTQISGIISAGLSCTWGTLSGGYVRHGNLNGVAMVTVQMQVVTNTVLSANTQYVITGFPTTYVNTPAIHTYQSNALLCYMEYTGTIRFTPLNSVPSGRWLEFACTYLTNS